MKRFCALQGCHCLLSFFRSHIHIRCVLLQVSATLTYRRELRWHHMGRPLVALSSICFIGVVRVVSNIWLVIAIVHEPFALGGPLSLDFHSIYRTLWVSFALVLQESIIEIIWETWLEVANFIVFFWGFTVAKRAICLATCSLHHLNSTLIRIKFIVSELKSSARVSCIPLIDSIIWDSGWLSKFDLVW